MKIVTRLLLMLSLLSVPMFGQTYVYAYNQNPQLNSHGTVTIFSMNLTSGALTNIQTVDTGLYGGFGVSPMQNSMIAMPFPNSSTQCLYVGGTDTVSGGHAKVHAYQVNMTNGHLFDSGIFQLPSGTFSGEGPVLTSAAPNGDIYWLVEHSEDASTTMWGHLTQASNCGLHIDPVTGLIVPQGGANVQVNAIAASTNGAGESYIGYTTAGSGITNEKIFLNVSPLHQIDAYDLTVDPPMNGGVPSGMDFGCGRSADQSTPASVYNETGSGFELLNLTATLAQWIRPASVIDATIGAAGSSPVAVFVAKTTSFPATYSVIYDNISPTGYAIVRTGGSTLGAPSVTQFRFASGVGIPRQPAETADHNWVLVGESGGFVAVFTAGNVTGKPSEVTGSPFATGHLGFLESVAVVPLGVCPN